MSNSSQDFYGQGNKGLDGNSTEIGLDRDLEFRSQSDQDGPQSEGDLRLTWNDSPPEGS